MKLLIVESPSKAKTISKYVGKDYTVKASVGHVRDLPKSNKKAIDIEAGFVPHYVVSEGKEKVIDEIKRLAKKADEVLIATDPDREGEAIAWHITEAVELKNPKRVVFHEITKDAVLEALKHPRTIDEHLRRSQEARRVLDRLVGYDLSGVIWKKVRYGLSAGRVQSPALRILVEREKEIRAFEPETYFTITAEVKKRSGDATQFTLSAEQNAQSEEEVESILTRAKKGVLDNEKGVWTVADIQEKERTRRPKAPFRTSTLQQAASSELSMSPSRTMMLAQRLYEAGFITYMRTDSTALSAGAKKEARSIIEREHGKQYVGKGTFSHKAKNAQEAHEAIRPTSLNKRDLGADPAQKKLYNLIWRRTVASQMSDAKLKTLKLLVNASTESSVPKFVTTGSQTLFAGWLAVDSGPAREDVELPDVSTGDELSLLSISNEEKQTEPPNRYSEAGLVKELEKRGIGRPSTYASIIKTIQDRGYVEKEGQSLRPTDTGEVVSDFLGQNFEKYISDTFTSEMEDELDEIAEGKREYSETLEEFYKEFAPEVEEKKKGDKITDLGPAPDKFPCPECDSPMVIKLGKSGTFLSCSRFPDCEGARTIEGEPMQVKETGRSCPECGNKLIERTGKYGTFIGCSNYPKCKYIEEDEGEKKRRSTGIICPVCGNGEMTEKIGRFGAFYACSNYPKCKHTINAKPTGNICTYPREDKDGEPCGALMMEGTKTIPERCSDKKCPNHNPHKLEEDADKYKKPLSAK